MKSKQKITPILRFGFISLLILTSLACVATDSTPDESNNLAATQAALQQTQVAISVQQTVQAQGTVPEVPTAESTLAPAQPEPVESNPCDGKTLVNFQGVSFCYEPGLANAVQTELSAESYSEMSENFNEPQQRKFTFGGYTLSPAFHTPVIHVYPVAAYTTINPNAQEGITDLQAAIQAQSTNLEHMPFLPQWNAAQMMHMQTSYLTFQNGQGVRYLTQYGQAYWPINNEDLFYTFQGITDDGQYYISAILPISHPTLPANGDAYAGDINDLGNIYQSYLNDITNQINPQPVNSFNPQLNHLDAMMESFLVTP